MKYYMAPMEGFTGYAVRNSTEKCFPGIDKYFTPFLPTSEKLGNKYLKDIDPDNNRVNMLIPQIMPINITEVNHMYDLIKDYGYKTVNINLGCPSGTVVSKNRGSGMLKDPDKLDRFLYDIANNAACKISIKTRIGISSLDEYEEILNIYAKYSFDELIIHPRLQKDFYKGSVNMDAFKMAYEIINKSPLVYNGDITTIHDIYRIQEEYPNISAIMIGRGMFINPGMITALKSGGYSNNYRQTILSFHDNILNSYSSMFSGTTDILMHMKALWTYMGEGFTECDKYLKKIRKSTTITDFKINSSYIILNCPFSYEI